MATVNDILKRAQRLIGVSSIGESLSADEAADGLTALNSMLASWANEKLMLFKFETIGTTQTAQSFTIGATGDVVTTRPLEIVSAYRRQGNIDVPVMVGNRIDYEDTVLKSQAGPVQMVYYKPTFPNGTVFVWPVPVGETLFLTLQQPLTAFTTVTDVISLPPGYDEAITFNLAVLLAPEYETEAPPSVMRRAMASKKILKSVNNEIPQLEIDPALSGQPSNAWWVPPK